jgi:hypothetical protein
LGSTPTNIDTADTTTGWTGTSVNNEPDLKVEGSNSIACILRNDLATIDFSQASVVDMTGQHVRGWINFGSVGFLDTEANNGMEFYMIDQTNNFTSYWTVFSSDDYSGGWFNLVLDCDSTPDRNNGTDADVTDIDTWGFRFNRTGAPANKDNTWVDYFHYGNGYYATGGTSGDEIDLAGITALDLTNAYGVLSLVEGVYFSKGEITIGNGATTTWFEMLSELLIFTDSPVSTTLYALVGAGSGCRITIDGSVIRASGSGDLNRFDIDMSDTNLAAVTITDNLIVRADGCIFDSGQTVTGNKFVDCYLITHGGADMTDCIVDGYEGASDTAAMLYNVNADPDGEMDNMTFIKGTASTHALEFGSTSPSEVTLRGWTTSGYNASDGQTDSTFYNNTGGALTINIVGGSGNFSYKNGAAASTTVVVDPVTTEITVKDAVSGGVISGAYVVVYSADGTNFPYQVTVNITGSGTTATVAHTGHGLATGDKVLIYGAEEDEYNGTFSITVTGVDAYTYTTTSTVSASPATGTIKATFAFIKGTTDGSGLISDQRALPSGDQPITGWARKSTSSPFYKEGPIEDTVDSSNGKDITVLLVSDE